MIRADKYLRALPTCWVVGLAALLTPPLDLAAQRDGNPLLPISSTAQPKGTKTPAPASPMRVAQRSGSPTENPNVEYFSPGQTLAVVGGYPIFASDMAAEVNALLDQFLPNAPKSVRDQQRPELIRKLLPKYIDSKLMFVDVLTELPEEADLEGIFQSAAEQFDESVLPMLQEELGANSTAEMDAYLRSQGSSLRLMRKSWSENEFTKYMVRQKLDADPDISRQELLDYYRAHQNEFSVEAKARWEEIMVRFDRFSSRLEAKQAIAQMGNEIIYGASFPAVAKRGSHGLKADQGGRHDWTVQGSLLATSVDQAVFELPLNVLSDIIESQHGYHIIRVLERTEAGTIPFAEAQTEIRKKLQTEKRQEQYQKHLEQLRQSIPIDILIDEP